ncbi:hypothetical protein [Longimycelium tulufanense]|uniref:hypothetical protein n=1 Tax=Longimycelium tulufanense TaxID=907463 RepID=UPI001668290B|nr:hypothetical protein [Longimycelium tulufanense]
MTTPLPSSDFLAGPNIFAQPGVFDVRREGILPRQHLPLDEKKNSRWGATPAP